MQKIKGWNRNIFGGKRPHKGIQKYGKYKELHERLLAEVEARAQYFERIKKK